MAKSSSTEQWRPIMSFAPGKYEVSDLGRVRRAAWVGSGGKKHPARVVKQWDNGQRAANVTFYDDHTKVNRRVGMLVAEAFMADQPGKWVLHHDGDNWNNRLSNLFKSDNRHNPESRARHLFVGGKHFKSAHDAARYLRVSDTTIRTAATAEKKINDKKVMWEK